MPGVVAVVRDGSFVGVVAETEAAAEAGLAALRKARDVERRRRRCPTRRNLAAWLKSQPVETTTVDERKAGGTAPRSRARVRRQLHAPVHRARLDGAVLRDRAVDWRRQAARSGRTARASTACAPTSRSRWALPPESIVVQHVEGAGCYGHNGADDVAFDAVLLARAAGGRPVRLQWSREDELAWSPMGAAMAIEIEADLDASGDIVDWRGDVWSNGHVSRPGRGPDPDRCSRPRSSPSRSSASSPSTRR